LVTGDGNVLAPIALPFNPTPATLVVCGIGIIGVNNFHSFTL